MLRLLWGTHPGLAGAMFGLRLARAFMPAATLWLAKLVIDQIVTLVRQHGGSTAYLWRLVVLELALVVASETVVRLSGLVEALLTDLFAHRVNLRIMEHAATLALQQFEDSVFYDRLDRARQNAPGRMLLVQQVITMAQSILTLLSLSGVLAAQAPWLVGLLVVAVIPHFIGETRYAFLSYSLMFRQTPVRRQLEYFQLLGTSNTTAKEIQMLALAPWLTQRYRRLADASYAENRALTVRRTRTAMCLAVLSAVVFYGAYATAVQATLAGAITIGTLTYLEGAFRQTRDLLLGLLASVSNSYENALRLEDLRAFLDTESATHSPPSARPVPTPIMGGVVFENVGFRYPGTDRWAVRGLSTSIRPGERVALVGANGAGKTTVTKLLARLYDPTEGRILLDGVDLRDYDIAGLRRAIGVLFQDFVHYDMRFDENIGVGDATTVDALASAVVVPEPVRVAADQSLADTLLPRLPLGYAQMLGRRFEEGVELSGGEWQKVALARAYMRDAQILILDEPTAALDAQAEYDVFAHFNQLMQGRMAVVISHRFSTVRMADRILVLSDGMITEDGTHEALVAAGGRYAAWFHLQADGYR
jgi:ATP-binding cassette subfamily B protein